MANIPIEPTRRSNLLPILLGALAALALLFFLVRGCGDNDGQPGDVGPIGTDTTAAATPPMDDTPFTSVDDILADSAQCMDGGTIRSGEGRPATLTDVRVTRVVGDSTFYVEAANGRRLFVVLQGMGESETTGTPADGGQAIREGDTVTLDGRLICNSDFTRYGMAADDLVEANRSGLMLRARRVEGAPAV